MMMVLLLLKYISFTCSKSAFVVKNGGVPKYFADFVENESDIKVIQK
jgi:hypothetical protein